MNVINVHGEKVKTEHKYCKTDEVLYTVQFLVYFYPMMAYYIAETCRTVISV